MLRGFIKHRVFGTVLAVEFSPEGEILAGCPIGEGVACQHRLVSYIMTLDGAEDARNHKSDWAAHDIPCTDANHLLADIGAAERACAEAETDYNTIHAKAKAAKDILEERQQRLRKLVRAAVAPVPLPLFDQAGL